MGKEALVFGEIGDKTLEGSSNHGILFEEAVSKGTLESPVLGVVELNLPFPSKRRPLLEDYCTAFISAYSAAKKAFGQNSLGHFREPAPLRYVPRFLSACLEVRGRSLRLPDFVHLLRGNIVDSHDEDALVLFNEKETVSDESEDQQRYWDQVPLPKDSSICRSKQLWLRFCPPFSSIIWYHTY